QLNATLTLPLAAYAGAPVEVRLDDRDSTPIVRRALPALAPKGKDGTTFEFKARGAGLQQVTLKPLKTGGGYQMKGKAKEWFTTAAANDTADNTRLTVTVGAQCVTKAATTKTD